MDQATAIDPAATADLANARRRASRHQISRRIVKDAAQRARCAEEDIAGRGQPGPAWSGPKARSRSGAAAGTTGNRHRLPVTQLRQPRNNFANSGQMTARRRIAPAQSLLQEQQQFAGAEGDGGRGRRSLRARAGCQSANSGRTGDCFAFGARRRGIGDRGKKTGTWGQRKGTRSDQWRTASESGRRRDKSQISNSKFKSEQPGDPNANDLGNGFVPSSPEVTAKIVGFGMSSFPD